ncbi:MAG: DNA repair protein RecO [Synechococcus sp.]
MGQRRIYRATGINLKVIPLGEADRIMTILTPERGLIRAVASGARQQKSLLGGRTELFAINQLEVTEGRSLDRISQADMVQNFSHLRSSLAKLTVAQYWAEVVLYQALSEQPQEALFLVLLEHLERLERSPTATSPIPLLVHGLYHLLAIAGLAPQVRPCSDCPGTTEWSFSPDAGGVACQHCIARQRPMQRKVLAPALRTVLKLLPSPELPTALDVDLKAWREIEHLLRKSIRYHFDREIQSALMVDRNFEQPSPPAPSSPLAWETGGTYG